MAASTNLETEALEGMALWPQRGLFEFKQVISGGIAGCVAKTAVAPLSRVTILMQVQSMRPQKYYDGMNPNNQSLTGSIVKIWREEGFRGYWRGNGAMALHRFPYIGITFQANAAFKRRLDQWCGGSVPSHVISFLAAGCSACLACGVCYPLDVVKTRLTAQTKTRYYDGIFDALARICHEEGLQGWYRGLGVSMCCVVPMIAFNFTLYDHFYWLYADLGMPAFLHKFIAGGSSGAMSSCLIFPADLLRRQMQMVGLGGRKAVYGGALDAVRSVYRTGQARNPQSSSPTRVLLGMREFFRGLVPELLKVTPYNAIMFAVHGQLLAAHWPFERRHK